MLANPARTGYLPEAYVPARSVGDGRALHSYWVRLVSLRTMLKNRVHKLLGRMRSPHPKTDLVGKKGREFLMKALIRTPY